MEYEITVKIRALAPSAYDAEKQVKHYLDNLKLGGIEIKKVIEVFDTPKPVFPVGLSKMGYTEDELDKDNPHNQWMNE